MKFNLILVALAALTLSACSPSQDKGQDTNPSDDQKKQVEQVTPESLQAKFEEFVVRFNRSSNDEAPTLRATALELKNKYSETGFSITRKDGSIGSNSEVIALCVDTIQTTENLIVNEFQKVITVCPAEQLNARIQEFANQYQGQTFNAKFYKAPAPRDFKVDDYTAALTEGVKEFEATGKWTAFIDVTRGKF